MGTLRTFTEKNDLEAQPAETALDPFTKVPDYKGILGFVHQVVDDLKIVFEIIPRKYKKLVIFVDDLDRCSPQNVARVMEGINLFLAGEFPGCVFLLGMDAEMVASALEKAHEDVILKLPSYSKNIPIGWRFMDKLVQLPIVIPPFSEIRMKEYAGSLVTTVMESKKSSNKSEQALSQTIRRRSYFTGFRDYMNRKFSLFDRRDRFMRYTSNKPMNLGRIQQEILKEMDAKIKKISDQDKVFLDEVTAAASEFSNNPREIKRFMNVLRFQRFLLSGIPNDENPPSFPQVRRWIILSLKWPQVVRWLYYSSELASIKERLNLLESGASKYRTQMEWTNFLKKDLKLRKEDEVNVQWVYDQNLWNFFKDEAKLDDDKRLSSNAGCGLY